MFPIKTATDARIVRNILNGDVDAFGYLVRRYWDSVYALAYAHLRNHADAEDTTQEAFVRAFVHLDALEAPARFGPWVLAIARNLSRTTLTRRPSELPLHGALEVGADGNQTQDIEMDNAEIRNALHRELEKLDPDSREVLSLHYFAGNSTREIARMMGISRDAVKKRLERSRARLGERLVAAFESNTARRRLSEERAQTITRAIVATPAPWLGAPAVPWIGQILQAASLPGGGQAMKTAFFWILVAGIGVGIPALVVWTYYASTASTPEEAAAVAGYPEEGSSGAVQPSQVDSSSEMAGSTQEPGAPVVGGYGGVSGDALP